MSEIETTKNGLERRSVIKGAAWSVPVIAAAVATPLASASPTGQAALDLNAGCVQIAGLQLLPGYSVKNTGTAPYSTAASGTISVTETIDLSAIYATGGIAGAAAAGVRAALWTILLVQGAVSGATTGVTRGNWYCAANCSTGIFDPKVPTIYSRTVTFTGTIAAGGQAAWGSLLDLTAILNALGSFGLTAIKRYATITSPTGNPPVVDAGPSDLSWNPVGGC